MPILGVGTLKKMHVREGVPIQYALPLGDSHLDVNPFLGQHIQLRYLQAIHCIQCGRKTKTSFQQGYCYPCMQRLAECDYCIIHPEKCHVEQGGCAPEDWAHAHCSQPHVVYLANTSGLKVGITRSTNIPSRWMDQGATQALAIFTVSNRLQAGLLEVIYKKHMADKTNWRDMLKKVAPLVDLAQIAQDLFEKTRAEVGALQARYPITQIQPFLHETERRFVYPTSEMPVKLKTLSFDQTPVIHSRLLGIKGQYLLFDEGVLNIRKFSGYCIEASCL